MVEAPKAAGDKPSEPTIEKTVLGNETVDGRECEKSTVKIKSEGSAEVVLTVWADKGRKNLPVKIATSDSGVNLVMEFRDFKETKPDAKLFAEPTGYQKYPSVQEMLMANMQKLMQAAPAR
jgi:hypothetical protein